MCFDLTKDKESSIEMQNPVQVQDNNKKLTEQKINNNKKKAHKQEPPNKSNDQYIQEKFDSLVQSKNDELHLSQELFAQLCQQLAEENSEKINNNSNSNSNSGKKGRNKKKNNFNSFQKHCFKIQEYVSINKDVDAVSSISSKSVKYLHKKRLAERGYRMTNKKLGEGGYGAVYKVYLKNAPSVAKPLACKIMLLSRRDKSVALENCANEIHAMKSSQHINIVSNKDSFIYSHALSTDHIIMSHSYILMEYAELGTLWAKLKKCGPFNEEASKEYIKQISNGLLHLHLRGIAHRDLKLGNILLTNSEKCQEIVKLADFGLSRVVNTKESGLIKFSKPAGTLAYMSPQILQCYITANTSQKGSLRYSYDPFRADLWALGVCLYLLLTKSHPFDNPPPNKAERIVFAKKMLEKQMRKEWPVPTGVHGTVLDTTSPPPAQFYTIWFVHLLDKLLEPYSNKRINIYGVNKFLNAEKSPLNETPRTA